MRRETTMKGIVLLAVCLLGFLARAHVRQNMYHFKHYNINSELSLNTVMAIAQDSKGFMWFGTKNGLNRFDGKEFKIFKRDSRPGSLRNSMIYSLAEDKEQRLWVATDKGISVYDPRTERFADFDVRTPEGTAITDAVNQLAVDTRGRVWILAGPSLYLFDPPTGRLRLLDGEFDRFARFAPRAFCLDDDGTAYICFPGTGIVGYNPDGGPASLLCAVSNSPIAISPYRQDSLLYGTISQGLYAVHKRTGQGRKVTIEGVPGSDIFVRAICPMEDGEYWVGSESGIYVLRPDGAVTHIGHEDFNDQSLSDNAIYAICRDRQGGVWVGSYFGGVDYIPARQHMFFRNFVPVAYRNSLQGFRVREFVEDARGNLWIATEDNGLNYYDRQSGHFSHISTHTRPLSLSFSNIQCLNLAGDKLWVGTFSQGIDVIDLRTRTCRHYAKAEDGRSIDNNDIFAIYTDRRGTTWIGTSSSIFTYDPHTDSFRPFEQVRGVFISDIWQDREGYIWFSTYNRGLIRYNPQTGVTTDYRYDPHNPQSLCYDRITCIFEDRDGTLWFGSEDGGFCRYQTDNTFLRVTTAQGLPSNVIYAIVQDRRGHLWLSTSNGLVDFDPRAMRVEATYNRQNGLMCKQFNYASGIRAKDGTLFFGSIDGFVAFKPQDSQPESGHCPVVLTGLYLLNQEVTADSTSTIMDQAMPYARSIRLDYDQATFSLGFSALNYAMEGDGHYAYMLHGVDKAWNYAEDVSRVSYNSIPPGNYTFRIKYSKDGHDWNGPETRLTVSIRPPLWRTSWAYVLYAAAAIGLAALAIRYYAGKKRRQMEQRLEQQEQQKKEELYQAKIDFFTNIAHEIRTPITLIKAPLDYILTANPVEDEVKENLYTMERNTDRLLFLVNQLLDFRKIESNTFTLQPKVKDINTLVSNTYIRFLPTARQRHLEMTLTCPPQDVLACVDEEALTKVCSNLFNNAVKYAATYVRICLTQTDDDFRLSVHNDGRPIPPDMRQRIFEPFFQIKENTQPTQPGSGIGLTLASSLVKLHDGRLFLDAEADDTCFVMQMPKHLPAAGATAAADATTASPVISLPGQADEAGVPHPADTAGEGHADTLLVVEDNAELRLFLQQQLGRHYRVLTAENGRQALDVLDRELVHLIVSDVMMPEMDGLELCQHIKNNLETCHIPLILLTAKTTLDNKLEGLKHGADAYIEKPFAMPHLVAQIDNLLESRRRLRQNFANSPYIATTSMAQNKADEDFLNRLTEVIRQNLDNEEFDIDELAQTVGLSRTSMHRKLKAITGQTPGDFIRILRLKKAAELLLTGEYRINEICMLIGIRSLSYFSKSFKEQFGVLPKDFVKSQKTGKKPAEDTPEHTA